MSAKKLDESRALLRAANNILDLRSALDREKREREQFETALHLAIVHLTDDQAEAVRASMEAIYGLRRSNRRWSEIAALTSLTLKCHSPGLTAGAFCPPQPHPTGRQ